MKWLSRRMIVSSLILLFAFVLTSCVPLIRPPEPMAEAPTIDAADLEKINHIIIIFQENRGFDHLYGTFPGANGIANAGAAVQQVDKEGNPYKTLPQPIDMSRRPPRLDTRFPAELPVQPFDIAQYVPPDQLLGGNLTHLFYQEQYQINDGKMNKFVAWGDSGAMPMGYYNAKDLPVGKLALEYTLADNFFHGAFGGSFLNHMWLICACTPTWPNAPKDIVVQLDDQGMLIKDGTVTPDGYAVNTSFSINPPYAPYAPNPVTDTIHLLPAQTQPTIGDRLSEKNISWAWYAGGWNDVLAGKPDRLFIYHHQPFLYFANYAEGTAARAEHIKDEQDFLQALIDNSLPAVSFIKVLGRYEEHSGYSILTEGQQHVADLVAAVQKSPYWAETAIIITYDEHGGYWDHVAPPKVDRWGPGSRVPAIIISPYAKKGYVDSTQYDTTSILKLIETRWGLAPLGTRDAAANDMTNAFDFSLSTIR